MQNIFVQNAQPNDWSLFDLSLFRWSSNNAIISVGKTSFNYRNEKCETFNHQQREVTPKKYHAIWEQEREKEIKKEKRERERDLNSGRIYNVQPVRLVVSQIGIFILKQKSKGLFT